MTLTEARDFLRAELLTAHLPDTGELEAVVGARHHHAHAPSLVERLT